MYITVEMECRRLMIAVMLEHDALIVKGVRSQFGRWLESDIEARRGVRDMTVQQRSSWAHCLDQPSG